MSALTPVLLTALQIVSTLFFLVAVMKIAKFELDRLSFAIMLGLSIFLGYFLFWFVELLIATFAVGLILRMILKHKESEQKYVPPDFEEFRRMEEDEREE
jgi:hypothetical protein